jgi:mannan endo-1,4-beta-mannosidase
VEKPQQKESAPRLSAFGGCEVKLLTRSAFLAYAVCLAMGCSGTDHASSETEHTGGNSQPGTGGANDTVGGAGGLSAVTSVLVGGAGTSAGGGVATGGTFTSSGGSAETGGIQATGGSAEAGGIQATGGNAEAGGSQATGGNMAAGGSTTDLRPKTFIKTNGTQFDDAGKRFAFVGANFWQGMNLATNDATGDPRRLARELDRLQAMGITVVRVMAASEGPDGQPYRMSPALMQSPGQYNETVFRGLDSLLDALATRGMRAVMVLNNYWQWSGGMGQYVSWSDNSSIPYPVGGTSFQTFDNYLARFYDCSTCQQNYQNHIQTVIARINTVNGLIYRDDPTIFSWELANEPRRYLSSWVDTTASYIKSLDSNHMVTTGSEGTSGITAHLFELSHQSTSIDYGTCHIWAENYGQYNSDDSSATNLDSAVSYALNYLSQHERSLRAIGKPLVLEEFGLARDGWTAGGKYDPAATTTNRDKYFRTVFDQVEADMAANQSVWGDNFWAWAGEAGPSDPWIGDPPHETPGWYSVYDRDVSTLAVILSHAQNVATFRQ